MKLYSTKNTDNVVSLRQAVLQGLPEDNGLFMPTAIPQLPASFFAALPEMSFPELGFQICKALFQGAIPDRELRDLLIRAMTFDAPLVRLDEKIAVLELFHGPTLAFKDFGAAFMAQLMGYFVRHDSQKLYILVATSGDTGGAVARGFYQTPGIEVIILYPSGKVSDLQEKQLTTLGENITALEIDGTFDDCQAMVKQAFLDEQLRRRLRLSSANSINIARLIPQSFYYFRAYQQWESGNKKKVISVPSGNFGNLTAGLLAKKMGLPIDHFFAATNINKVVPEYLHSGIFSPIASVSTISNAMDVGNPSNFPRMLDLYKNVAGGLISELSGRYFSDNETREAMKEVADKYHYVMDPHGAVAYLGLKHFLASHNDYTGIFLESAHPAKFAETVNPVLGREIEIPERLASLRDKEKKAHFLSREYDDFREYLMSLPT